MLRGSNLSGDVGMRLNDADLVFLDSQLADGFVRSTAHRNDLVFTCWGTIGQIGFIDESAKYESYVVSNKQMKMTPDRQKVHPLFLYYLLSQPRMVDLVASQAIGSSVPGFNLGQLKALQVTIPDLSTQWGIAEVLGALDDKIGANAGVVTTADALAASLTRSALDMTQQAALNEIALITMGSSPPGTSYNEAGEGTVFYQGVRDFGVRYPANRVWTTEPVRMAKAGDSLLSVRAPVGQLNLSGEDTCIGRGLASVRSRAASPMTLFHLLRDAPEAWAPYEAEGTIFGSINKTQLEALRLPTVSEDLAEGLERQLDALETSIASCLDENLKLATMRDALLPQLMSGRIRVRDVEQMVGDVV
jgi:type I restriction enzyme S subunit